MSYPTTSQNDLILIVSQDGEKFGVNISKTNETDLSEYATKDDVGNVRQIAYKDRGSVDTVADLPTAAENGDVYRVAETGEKFVWFDWLDGGWDSLGSGGSAEMPEYLDFIPPEGVEVRTNRVWKDGRPIYRKFLDCGVLINGITYTDPSAPELNEVCDVYAYMTPADGAAASNAKHTPLSYMQAVGNSVTIFIAGDLTVGIENKSASYVNRHVYCIIEYTKTTDAENSYTPESNVIVTKNHCDLTPASRATPNSHPASAIRYNDTKSVEDALRDLYDSSGTGDGGIKLGNTPGQAAGTASAGTATTAARSDHTHPLQTSVSGNAGTATKLATARTITLSGDCTGSTSFDGSGNVTMTTTVLNGGVQLGNTPGQAATAYGTTGTAITAAKSDHTHPIQTSVSGNAGTATKLQTARTISLTGGVAGSGSFDGSANLSITTSHPTQLANARTIALSGAVSGSASFNGASNISISTSLNGTYAQLGSIAGQAATSSGTTGTATTAAKSDHTHPLQTSVSGNAGTATQLATARTIALTGDISGNVLFRGNADVSMSPQINTTTGAKIRFWYGTSSELPSTRSSDTIYFVTD